MAEAPPVVCERRDDVVRVVVMVERLTTDDRDGFVRALKEAVAAPEARVEVDLSRTGLLYSLFIGVLLDGIKKAKDAGKEVVVVAGETLRSLLMELGLDKAAPIRAPGE